MTASLYFDEDSMDRQLLRALRARGVDVESALDAGMIERPDEEHLRYATSRGRALFTFNVGDFCRLHSKFLAAEEEHSGIIVARQQIYSVGETMRRLLLLIGAVSAAEMRYRLEFLGHWARATDEPRPDPFGKDVIDQLATC